MPQQFPLWVKKKKKKNNGKYSRLDPKIQTDRGGQKITLYVFNYNTEEANKIFIQRAALQLERAILINRIPAVNCTSVSLSRGQLWLVGYKDVDLCELTRSISAVSLWNEMSTWVNYKGTMPALIIESLHFKNNNRYNSLKLWRTLSTFKKWQAGKTKCKPVLKSGESV